MDSNLTPHFVGRLVAPAVLAAIERCSTIVVERTVPAEGQQRTLAGDSHLVSSILTQHDAKTAGR